MEMTQRAYTLRLGGLKRDGQSWRERLWITHKKVNAGARMFGDFLLTLRGGVSPGENASDPVTRRLLALCWFSVESEAPETADFRVPTKDSADGRHADETAMRKAFEECLTAKKIDLDSWWDDCSPALMARVRDDSVWVQRWKRCKESAIKPSDPEIKNILGRLLSKDFLKPKEAKIQNTPAGKGDGDKAPVKSRAKEEQASRRVIQEARSLYGQWFGEGGKTDFSSLGKNYELLKDFAAELSKNSEADSCRLKKRIFEFRKTNKWDELKPKFKGKGAEKKAVEIKEPALSNPGRKSGNNKKAIENWSRALLGLRVDKPDEKPNGNSADITEASFWNEIKIGCEGWLAGNSKKERGPKVDDTKWRTVLREKIEKSTELKFNDKSGEIANTELMRLMFSAGAVRLSQTHSWMRRQELDRHGHEEALRKFSPQNDDAAAAWLDAYLKNRALKSGTDEPMAISKNALDGWKAIFKRWKKCGDEKERLDAVRELQDSEEKFGDASLFRALAADGAQCVREKEDTLTNYAKWTRAGEGIRRHKVPSYRHPDPFEHPVFCDFGNSRPGVKYGWQQPDMSHRHEIKMCLFDSDGKASMVKLRWQGARLNREMGLGKDSAPQTPGLSRNTRLGRQSAGDFPSDREDEKLPAALLKAKELNARLQISREELARIGRCGDKSKKGKLLNRVRWFVTFSPKLEPAGPWLDFVKGQAIAERLRVDGAPVWFAKKDKKWIENRKFGWMVRPGLGTLPGIRVLGVDLGHRHGAIGAIWRQISAEEIKTITKSDPPNDKISFVCDDPARPERTVKKKDGKERKHKPKLVFRRIGDNSWAKLERQFMIRLPGELNDIRSLVEWERKWLPDFLKKMGRTVGGIQEKTAKKITDARLEALNAAKSALTRHGDRIRIFHYLNSEKLPGMGGKLEPVKDRKPHIEKALRLWDRLAHLPSWDGGCEKELWKRHILSLSSELASPDLDKSGDASREDRKKREVGYKKIAEELNKKEKDALRFGIGETFKKMWSAEEKEWPVWLGALRSWVARGCRYDEGEKKWTPDIKQKIHAGGLSLDRISSLTLLSQIQRAYAQRPTDEVLWRESKPGERHGHAVREKLERLREDRLKKLANAVAMAALGLVAKDGNKKGNDKSRRVEKERHGGERFVPVQAVAIENLDHYRPEASRTRRENRGLMSWSAGEMSKRLGDACDLHGLLLVQVQPNYTSRLCSRCGAPGARCDSVKNKDLSEDWFWKKQVDKAKEEKEGNRTVLQKLLVRLSNGGNNGDNKKDDKPVLLPRNGGTFFVCSNESCSVSRGGVQADLNAAANIGLRALMDGRWEGAYSYLPTKNSNPDGKAGSLKGMPESLKSKTLADNGEKGKDGDTYNSFRDLSNPKTSMWKPRRPFFQEAEDKIAERLIGALAPRT